MALTVSQVGRNQVSGNRITAYYTAITDDTTWNAGGEAFDASATSGLKEINQVSIENSGGYVFEYDRANAKIKAYVQHDPAEETGGANKPLQEATGLNLTTITMRISVVGTRA